MPPEANGVQGADDHILLSRPVVERAFGLSGSPFFMSKINGVQIGYKIDLESQHIHCTYCDLFHRVKTQDVGKEA